MSILSIQNVGKAYQQYSSEWKRFASWFSLPVSPIEEHWVLRNINFEIKPGEAIGVIGQNGAGKSTLLKMITGTLQPTEGNIVTSGRIAAILELGMGFNPELTARQNVFHAAGLMGFPIKQINEMMPEIEEFAEIGEYFDEPIRTYSSGMQMRVAFAVATTPRPDILIIDEALSVGDAAFQRKCFRRIEKYMNDGMSLLLVSHDIESIKKLCTKALFISNCTQVMFGKSKLVCSEYEKHLFGPSKKTQPNIATKNREKDNSLELIDPELLCIDDLSYGDGRATINEVWLEDSSGHRTNILNADSQFTLKYSVSFTSLVETPVFSFLIKTMEGISLYGTDTISLGKETGVYNAGDSIEISFHMKNHLAANTYFINCGIRDEHNEKTVFIHRRIDIAIFKVRNKISANQTGLIDLSAIFHSNKTSSNES